LYDSCVLQSVKLRIPPQTRESGENSVPAGAVQGLNDWKRYRYGGPCPPSRTHRYFFKLHALDTTLTPPSATTRVHSTGRAAGELSAVLTKNVVLQKF